MEINSHEHFGHVVPRLYAVPDLPVATSAVVHTYELDELLATKLRALYQRRKGRDLFDLWWAHQQGDPEPARVVAILGEYQAAAGRPMLRASELRANRAAKRTPAFLEEVRPLRVAHGGQKPRFGLGSARYDRPMWPLLYLLIRTLVARIIGARHPGYDDGAKDLEILVLRHQLRVLQRTAGRPQLKPIDRVLLAAASRAIPRDR